MKKDKKEKKERYVPIRDCRFFPNHVSPERARAVAEMEIDWEDLTVDDLIHYYAGSSFRTAMTWVQVVQEMFGEEAVPEAMARFGEKAGMQRMSRWLKRFNTDAMDSEQMAYAQDLVHVIYGPNVIKHCFSQWEDDVCVARRTSCHLYTAAKEMGMDPKLCTYYCDTSAGAYEKLQPGMKTTRTKTLAFGDPYCEHVFSKMEKAPKAEGNPGKVPWPDEVKD